MRLTRKAALLGAAFALTSVFTLAACNDDPETTTQDLSGEYNVIGFGAGTPGSLPTVNPATGTATLSFDTYTITIDNPPVVSTGDYAAFQDGSFTQDGTTSIGGGDPIATQCTGTWAIDGDELTLDSTCSGQRSIVVLIPVT